MPMISKLPLLCVSPDASRPVPWRYPVAMLPQKALLHGSDPKVMRAHRQHVRLSFAMQAAP